MKNIGITGATGHLGYLVIKHLIDFGTSPESITAFGRDSSKTEKLKKLGVNIQLIDYNKPETMQKAFENLDSLLLVSSSDIGQRSTQHLNVVDAAVKNGINHFVYTSIVRADSSPSPLAAEHDVTEKAIKNSGLNYTILRNNWYTENHLNDVSVASKTGTIFSAAGDGYVCSATRSDYAEAAARVLSQDDHFGKTYELTGAKWNFNDLADAVSNIIGKKVNYLPVAADEKKKMLISAGLPDAVANFVSSLDVSIAEGALAEETDDLEKLIGRKPASLEEGLKAAM